MRAPSRVRPHARPLPPSLEPAVVLAGSMLHLFAVAPQTGAEWTNAIYIYPVRMAFYTLVRFYSPFH